MVVGSIEVILVIVVVGSGAAANRLAASSLATQRPRHPSRGAAASGHARAASFWGVAPSGERPRQQRPHPGNGLV